MGYVGSVFANDGETPFESKVKIEFNPINNDSLSVPPNVQNGVPSLFNSYAVVVFPTLQGEYNKVKDVDGNQFSPPATKNPSIGNLVNDSTLRKKEPYSYSDFLYCKYVGKIPNNQLITLRRYPAPTFDNLAVPSTYNGDPNTPINQRSTTDVQVQDEFFPIAQAVTWFGEATGNQLSDILSFNVNINWKAVDAEVNTVSGNEQGNEDSPLPGFAKFMGILTGQVNTPHATANSQYDPYNNGPYAHRVFGPVNVISKTFKRDRGIDFKQAITLKFEYSLKSIGNINPKAAMLDLMGNLLSLTYNNAAFWGGANRYFPQKPTYPFLGGKDGMNAWYRGEPVAFAKAVGSYVSDAKNGVMDMLGKLAEDPISALKSLAAGAAKLGMVEMGKGRAPSIVSIKSLLTGEPIGEWHMVVGNPYNPITKVGNLICTESKFKFNDTIGADDFPTELAVEITLEHGRPRDKGDIESMFNQGEGRIYYSPQNKLDVLNASSATRNSTNDNSWKPGYKSLPTFTTVGLFTGTEQEFNSVAGSGRQAGSDSAHVAHKLADLMSPTRSAGSGKKYGPGT